jgi:hypothetical protein
MHHGSIPFQFYFNSQVSDTRRVSYPVGRAFQIDPRSPGLLLSLSLVP